MPLLKTPFDTSALTSPVQRAAARTYARFVRDTFPELRQATPSQTSLIPAVVIATALTAMAYAMFALLLDLPSEQMGVTIALIIAVIPTTVFCTLTMLARRRDRRRLRLSQFAKANGLQFHPWASARAWRRSGTKFAAGTTRSDALNVVASPAARNLMVGTLRTESGTGKNKTVHVTDFVTLNLNRSLPHIVLDAKSNNGLGWRGRLGAEFHREQRLTLEGNFNETFTLYCPAGYETDALYLFTPDIMARMQDHAADWDVEIIDDEIYLYSPRRSVGVDAERWQQLGETINAVAAKLDQWERWRETRGTTVAAAQFAPDREYVAYEGRRLRKRFPWWMWIVLPVIAIFALMGIGSLLVDIVMGIIDGVRGIIDVVQGWFGE